MAFEVPRADRRSDRRSDEARAAIGRAGRANAPDVRHVDRGMAMRGFVQDAMREVGGVGPDRAECTAPAAAASATTSALERLTEINLDDLFDAMGLTGLRHSSLQRLLRPSARRFARVAVQFDRLVADEGLARGSAWLVNRMSGGLQVSGLGHVPEAGPTAILSNHPGMVDAVALLASLALRPDLLVIARDRPFLRALPNVVRHLIVVPDEDAGHAGRLDALRAAMRHLEHGGAVLTFPAGEIEPDPAVFGRLAAQESARRWSRSVVLLARRVPQTRFVPAIVSHVVSAEAHRNRLTRLRRSQCDRARFAAALQVCLARYRTQAAHVAFGVAQQVTAGASATLTTAIDAEVRRLIQASVGSGTS
ncbi:MAG: hypothetical protein EHM87_21095 [Burkholderiales bacterium]|nr:MAG: hypothetical protein EHM87_21095 [Burkholderiales bacterium]